MVRVKYLNPNQEGTWLQVTLPYIPDKTLKHYAKDAGLLNRTFSGGAFFDEKTHVRMRLTQPLADGVCLVLRGA